MTRRRAILVTALVFALALAAGAWSMVIGSARIGAPEVLQALAGQASAGVERVVIGWRLPRVLFTLLGGAALAIAGAIFQSQTRNPLGSPDIIGFTVGAYTAVLVASILGLSGIWQTPLAAIVGGLATGVAVYLLAWRGGVSGLRIILVGIGVSLFLSSINTYLLRTMRLEEAMSAAVWGAGSVNDVGWWHVLPLALVLALTLPVILVFARDMRLMEMGDDTAAGLGVNLEKTRLIQFTAAIALVAVVTAGAGPIAFVALVAPQLALRLVRGSSVSIVPSAAVGALLLTASDLIARAPFMPASVPVGVVTLCLGGTYFVYLLLNLGRAKPA